MKISLITINYNSAGDTADLIKNLQHQTDQDFELIVVDNASASNDRVLLRDAIGAIPNVSLIESDQNKGFSGGNNLGIHRALEQGSDWIVLINNDTGVLPRFITDLKSQLATKQGIVGIALAEGDRAAYAGCIKWLKPTLEHINEPLIAEDQSWYAIGAGVAIRRNVIEQIGFLDERYFLYFEDADYSIRARKKNISLSFINHPVITHRPSTTTRKLGAPLLLRYHYRNMFLFNSLHAPWPVKVILPIWAFFGIVKQIFKLISRPVERPESRAIFAGILDYLTGRYGKIM